MLNMRILLTYPDGHQTEVESLGAAAKIVGVVRSSIAGALQEQRPIKGYLVAKAAKQPVYVEKPKTIIYAITCTANGRKYIGSTKKGLASRERMHRASLQAGTHHNSALQADYDQFGEAAFKYEMLQDAGQSQRDYLLALEELHIALHSWESEPYNASSPLTGQATRKRPKRPNLDRHTGAVQELDAQGNVIAEWSRLCELARETGLNAYMVARVCLHQRNTHKGRFFRYVEATCA